MSEQGVRAQLRKGAVRGKKLRDRVWLVHAEGVESLREVATAQRIREGRPPLTWADVPVQRGFAVGDEDEE